MAANGILDFQGTNQVNFMGAASNIVIDTMTASLGIGVDVNGPTSNLHVVGNAHVSTNLTIGGNIDFIGNLTQGGAAYGGGSGGSSPWLPTTVNVPADGIYYTAGNVAVDTNTFFVDSVNDRVGIGTSSPMTALHVSSGTAGDCRLVLEADTDNNNEGDNPRIEFWQDGAVQESAIGMTNNRLNLWNSVGSGGISFHTNSVDGWTNAIERMTIDPDGNVAVDTNTFFVDSVNNRVGVGTTSPAQKLDVNGNIKLGGSGRQIYLDTGGAGLYWGSGYSRIVDDGDLRICTDDNLHFNTNCSSGSLGIERMVLKANGSVGIGVTAPDRLFHVNGTSRFVGEVEWFETGQSTSHANYGANRDWYIRSGAADGKVVIQDIHATSNVGIGTSTPGYKLDVTGDINYTGVIRRNGTIQALNSPFLTNGVAPNRKAYYTDGPVGIANVSALTTQTLQIGANVVVNDTASDKLVVSGSMYLSKNLKVVDEIFAYKITAAEFEQKDVVIVANQPPTAIIMN
jgi:hypothetical protein